MKKTIYQYKVDYYNHRKYLYLTKITMQIIILIIKIYNLQIIKIAMQITRIINYINKDHKDKNKHKK
jgi:hypothetical protein